MGHLPGQLICAGTGQQHRLLGEVSHDVPQRVGQVHGVVHSRVVKLHVHGVVQLVVVTSHDADRVPHLREKALVITPPTTSGSFEKAVGGGCRTMKRCVRCVGVEPGWNAFCGGVGRGPS